jgi:hypothetical protein
MRRAKAAYERARRKHDKFVKPEGTEPIPIPITMRPDSPAPRKEVRTVAEPDQFDDPNDKLIVDEWLQGSGDKVLFEGSEFYGEFNFRDTILDQLDRYWVYLDRMRKHDRDAYEFYKILGATLMPYSATHTWTTKPTEFKDKRTPEELEQYRREIELPPWFKTKWPAFGCVAFGINPVEEKIEITKNSKGWYQSTPKFMYFRKLKRSPWTVQPVVTGKVYSLTIWWDRPNDPKRPWKWGRPQEFPIHISNDGKLRVLKTRQRSSGKIGPWWDWRIPHDYDNWATQHGLDAQSHLTHMFCDCVKHVEFADFSMLRVEITKDDMHAIFGISPRRMAYFFQDRDIVLTAKGRKRRVFHFVRPHIRKDGAAVHAHFRGLKEFHWASYDVRITVPGRDHMLLSEFDVPVEFDPIKKKGQKYLTEGQTAKWLAQQMKDGQL